MSSTFTWLDYSEHERRKMLDVIELFGEKTTRDELGLGGVRDAFADLLFPGTTTIQTVAKYFLFVPWMYLGLERKKIPSAKIQKRARDFEISLAKQLGDADGVIGKRAKETLKRLPSSVYWQGLLAWGIRVYPKSQAEYHRSLDVFYARQTGRAASAAEFEGEGVLGDSLVNWHTGIVAAPPEFPDEATLELTYDEAAYLRERVITNCSQSLLAYLLANHVDVQRAEFAWQLGTQLPDHLAVPVRHARSFSETIHGAQLLYNMILAEKTSNDVLIDEYHERLTDWWSLISSRASQLMDWDRLEFWSIVTRQNPRVSSRAKKFIDQWINLVQGAGTLASVLDGQAARNLVELREFQIKGKLARTRSQRARDLWSGAAGSEQLDLRWRTTRRIIADILHGLEVPADAAAQ